MCSPIIHFVKGILRVQPGRQSLEHTLIGDPLSTNPAKASRMQWERDGFEF
jgi:hypothetical protein